MKNSILSRRLRIALLTAAGLGVLAVPIIAFATAGTVVGTSKRTPCWWTKGVTGPTGFTEVLIGNAHGTLQAGTPGATADAFFDNDAGDCGLDDLAVNNPTGHIILRMESAVAFDNAASASGNIKFDLLAKHSDTVNCAGPFDADLTRSATVTFAASPAYDWKEVDPYSSSFYFDVGVPPEANSSYYYEISVTPTQGGTTYSAVTDSGCFNIAL
jgi:hypothetical protein